MVLMYIVSLPNTSHNGVPLKSRLVVEYRWGTKKFAIFDHHHHHIRFISEMIQDRATVIMKCQFELVCDLYSGTKAFEWYRSLKIVEFDR